MAKTWYKHLDGFYAVLERVYTSDEVAARRKEDELALDTGFECDHIKGPLLLLDLMHGAMERKVFREVENAVEDRRMGYSEDGIEGDEMDEWGDEMDEWDDAMRTHEAGELCNKAWVDMKSELYTAVHFAVKKARVRELFVHWQEASYAPGSTGRKRHLCEYEASL